MRPPKWILELLEHDQDDENDPYPYRHYKDNGQYVYTPPKPLTCECGSEKIGMKTPGPGHSQWCPLYKKD